MFQNQRDQETREKTKTKIEFDYQSGELVEKRMKHNAKLMHKRKEQERDDNKLIVAQE